MNRLNYEKVFKTLVEETGNYLVNHSLRAMVLGVSGGIDSTVVAAICCEVNKQTNIPLIGRSLPIKNKKDEFDVSKLVGEAFCNNFDVANLYDEYKCFLSGLVWREERIDLLDDTETKWEYRLAMAKETFDNIPGVVVDGIEYRISNGEPLPTYKTIEALKEIYGEFTIVTSAETYKEIPRWQHGEEILKNNKFLVVDVAHFDSEDISSDDVDIVYAPDITICSTAIRMWVDNGEIILPL